MRIAEYDIADEINPFELTKAVSQRIKLGFEPHGSAFSYTVDGMICFMQPMVRYDPEPCNSSKATIDPTCELLKISIRKLMVAAKKASNADTYDSRAAGALDAEIASCKAMLEHLDKTVPTPFKERTLT